MFEDRRNAKFDLKTGGELLWFAVNAESFIL